MNESDPRSDMHYLGSSENKSFFLKKIKNNPIKVKIYDFHIFLTVWSQNLLIIISKPVSNFYLISTYFLLFSWFSGGQHSTRAQKGIAHHHLCWLLLVPRWGSNGYLRLRDIYVSTTKKQKTKAKKEEKMSYLYMRAK